MHIFFWKSNFLLCSLYNKFHVWTFSLSCVEIQPAVPHHTKEVRVVVKKWECFWGELMTSFQVWQLQDIPAFSLTWQWWTSAGSGLHCVVATNTEGNVSVVCRWLWLRCVKLCCVLYSQTTENTAGLHNNCRTACSRLTLTSTTTRKRKFDRNNVTV